MTDTECFPSRPHIGIYSARVRFVRAFLIILGLFGPNEKVTRLLTVAIDQTIDICVVHGSIEVVLNRHVHVMTSILYMIENWNGRKCVMNQSVIIRIMYSNHTDSVKCAKLTIFLLSI